MNGPAIGRFFNLQNADVVGDFKVSDRGFVNEQSSKARQSLRKRKASSDSKRHHAGRS